MTPATLSAMTESAETALEAKLEAAFDGKIFYHFSILLRILLKFHRNILTFIDIYIFTLK